MEDLKRFILVLESTKPILGFPAHQKFPAFIYAASKADARTKIAKLYEGQADLPSNQAVQVEE